MLLRLYGQKNRPGIGENPNPVAVEHPFVTLPVYVEPFFRHNPVAVKVFQGANPALVKMLQDRGYLPDSFPIATCPITGERLDYDKFVNDVLHPSHGRSAFQVGHLNPLKTVSTGESWGHTASNISWISDDGNRIQGSLSMAEVDELLIKTYINRGFASKVEEYLSRNA